MERFGDIMKNSALTYGSIARWLHWVNAILLIVVFLTSDLEDGSPLFYWGHIMAGLAALGFTTVQIVWHFADKTPDALPDLPNWRKMAINWNHWLIMITAFLGTTSGVILWQTDTLEDFHEFLAAALVLLFLMHVGGVFLYQFTKGDSLGRMGLKIFKRS